MKPTNGAWQDVRVSLGPDAEVTGKLSFATPTRIEGKLKGELRASDLLIIGAQAVVQANVHAEKLIVLGRCAVRSRARAASRSAPAGASSATSRRSARWGRRGRPSEGRARRAGERG